MKGLHVAGVEVNGLIPSVRDDPSADSPLFLDSLSKP